MSDSTLGPEAQAFVDNPDDPRHGNANKVVLSHAVDGITVTYHFPEDLGPSVSESGLGPQHVLPLAGALAENGWAGDIDPESGDFVFTAPEPQVEDQAA